MAQLTIGAGHVGWTFGPLDLVFVPLALGTAFLAAARR